MSNKQVILNQGNVKHGTWSLLVMQGRDAKVFSGGSDKEICEPDGFE